MHKIGVVVAHAREDYVAASLVKAVLQGVDLQLVGGASILTNDPQEALSLAPSQVDAIIIIGSPAELEQWSHQLLLQSPELVVIRVTLGSDVVDFSRRGVGHEALLETLRTLTRIREEDARTADYVALESPHAVSTSDVTLVESIGATRNDLAAARRWLDSTLLAAVTDWPTSHGDLNLGAGTVSHMLAGFSRHSEHLSMSEENAELLDVLFSRTLASGRKRLSLLVQRFGLSGIEAMALVLCLAPDLDLRYGRVFGFLHDDASRRFASLDLITTLLGDVIDVRRALSSSGLIFESRLLAIDGARLPYADEALRVDPAVSAWLMGAPHAWSADRSLGSSVRRDAWPGAALLTLTDDQALRSDLRRELQSEPRCHRWILLAGDIQGWRGVVDVAAQRDEMQIIRIDAASLLGLTPAERWDVASRIARNILIDDVIPIIDASSLPSDASSLEIVEAMALALARTDRPCVLIAGNADRLAAVLPARRLTLLRRPPASAAMRVSYFKLAAKVSELDLDLSDAQAASIASVFALPLTQIEQAAQLAAAGSSRQESTAVREQRLRDACRRIAAPNLLKVANRVPPIFSLDQVVLPAQQKSQLAEVVANVRLSSQVLDQWGLGTQLPYGRGVTALFTGPSGTGKTMAAQGIARELGADLYVIDLSRVVSKWIGETEKNIDTAFSEAEGAGAVLLFDEADALFARRSPATDAHARHANLEVAYLLQRMEAFTGLAILTTNLRHNLDEAFLRRLRFVIEFTKPDTAAREKIWRQCFVGVSQLSNTVNFADLARRIEVPGGNIRQIALRAAFAAAADSGEILTKHLYEAARSELLKLGMPSAAGELNGRAA